VVESGVQSTRQSNSRLDYGGKKPISEISNINSGLYGATISPLSFEEESNAVTNSHLSHHSLTFKAEWQLHVPPANPLKPSGNYMYHLHYQSVIVLSVFMGLV
jgi:hypothetical protein